MLAQLAVTLPGMAFATGSPERKIVDVVGEALSMASVSQYLTGSLLDIDTKSGMELEQFVGIFGFGRLQGSAAVGSVTITMNMAQTTSTPVDQGTQFYTSAGLAGVLTQLFFSCTQANVLPPGNTSIAVPVQCTTVGSGGNVPPGSVTFLSSVLGAASCTNLQAMTGGVDVETDAELRQRFKDTLLRNIAGTSDWYQAIALQNTNVTQAVVFGPISLYQTQIVAPSQTSGSNTLDLTVNQDVKYVWPDMNSCFTDLGQEDEVFYSPVDDFNLSSGVSPVFTNVTTGQIAPSTIVDLEFQYTTACSRNDPVNGITNKVDLFVAGADPFTVSEQTVVTSQTLSATSSSPFYVGKFKRVNDTGSPSSTNRFMRLGSVPIITFPTTIVSGSTVYTQGTHYHLLQDTTLLAGSQFETSGIEWESAGPSTGTELTLQYVYNRVPEVLTAVVNTSKQITTDVMVHAAPLVYVQPCLSVEYDRTYSVATVNNAVQLRLQTFFNNLGFGSQIHLSSLLLAAQQVLGVVSVSLTTSAQNPTTYGVQLYTNSGDASPASTQTSDFKLNDNTLGQLLTVQITRVATP
jgi:uncharacterized phage protein gp47/JayE